MIVSYACFLRRFLLQSNKIKVRFFIPNLPPSGIKTTSLVYHSAISLIFSLDTFPSLHNSVRHYPRHATTSLYLGCHSPHCRNSSTIIITRQFSRPTNSNIQRITYFCRRNPPDVG